MSKNFSTQSIHILRSDNQKRFESIFPAKSDRITFHLKSIIMDDIMRRKSHQNGFFLFQVCV